jgi:hypothetical protein
MTTKRTYTLREAAEYHGVSWSTSRRAFIRSGMQVQYHGKAWVLTLQQVKRLANYFDKNHPNAKGQGDE